MSASPAPQTKPTLGLTGLTVNAMALIAPGAFLWLTFAQQCLYGQPMAAIAMWFGIIMALLLCFATAISYAELSKLYPGAGSSYFFAEQAFLSKAKAFKFARIAKFTVGWASHLYYWIYPGVMVAVTAILFGYLAGQLFPSVFSSATPSPLLMILFCLVFPLFVAWIAYSGVNASTGVNLAINVIQISALIVFTVIAIAYRVNHVEGAKGITLNPDGVPVSKVIATTTTKDDKGVETTAPTKDKDGNCVFGSPQAGWWFMFIQAIPVFLALIGTTLACINTGARVTYAMGRDDELAGNLGVLHTKNLTPHRAIWTLAVLSALIGIFGVIFYFCGGAALTADAIKGLPQNLWYSFGIWPHDTGAAIPQSLLIITLTSNFGTFLLYMMTCIVAIVAFREHHSFHGFKHVVVPVFGLLANLLCMLFYLVGPFSVAGMSFKEPYIALGIAALWGIYGAIFFLGASKKKAKSVLIESVEAKA